MIGVPVSLGLAEQDQTAASSDSPSRKRMGPIDHERADVGRRRGAAENLQPPGVVVADDRQLVCPCWLH